MQDPDGPWSIIRHASIDNSGEKVKSHFILNRTSKQQTTVMDPKLHALVMRGKSMTARNFSVVKCPFRNILPGIT